MVYKLRSVQNTGMGMSRNSAQVLICFIAYIFQFLYSSAGLVGNFARLPPYTVPSAIVHCNQSGRSPKVVALFSATNFSSNIIELLQLHGTIQIK